MGIAPDIAIPPLHRFYVLDFRSISGESERDDIIEELASASKLQHVSANYVAKLNAAPGDELYSGSLIWFQPYLQTWWPQINDAASFIALALMKPANVHDGMALLYPASAGTRLARARTIRYTPNPALSATHYQFPERPAYPKDVCSEFLRRPFARATVAGVPPILAGAQLAQVAAAKSAPGSFMGLTMPGVTPQRKATAADIGMALKRAGARTRAAATARTQTPLTPKPLPSSPRPMRCADGEVLVKYAAGMAAADRRSVEADVGLTRIKHFALSNSYFYAVNTGKDVTQVLSELQSRPEISYAEPNVSFEPQLLPSDPDFQSGSAWHLLDPADALSGSAMGISAPGAWDRTTGSRSVIVAVIDNGITIFHPDFYDSSNHSNLFFSTVEDGLVDDTDSDGDGLNDRCNFPHRVFTDCQDQDGNGYAADVYGWNFLDDNGNVEDQHGHGTAMSGLIGAVGNNGLGLPGVSWQVTLLPLKVASSESPEDIDMLASDLIEAVNYAASRGASIVNMSFGSSDSAKMAFESTDLGTTIRNAPSMLFVASAGNINTCLDQNVSGCRPYAPHYPAGYTADNIISVGASTSDGTMWTVGAGKGSNFGPTSVDVFAPGSNTRSLDTNGGSSSPQTGTSASAALVSGTAALMYAACPGMTPTAIKQAIIDTVHPVSQLEPFSVAGGVVDAKEAVEQCLNLNDSDPNNDKQPLNECEALQEACLNSNPAEAHTISECEALPGTGWNQEMYDAGFQACLCQACSTGYSGSCSISAGALGNTTAERSRGAAFGSASLVLLVLVSRLRRRARLPAAARCGLR